jgi:nitrous oxide reductase accessory protein NosL
MRRLFTTTLAMFVASTLLAACQQGDDTAAAPGGPAAEANWPASLMVFGDGFPNPGDPCRRIGESQATVNFLDHTATLAGCQSAADAARLGGRIVGTVDGVTLVSIPTDAAPPGQ